MPDNPKILGLLTHKDGHRAAFVWVCAMAYAGKHGTAARGEPSAHRERGRLAGRVMG
jgi:inosine/xanthosine triphosphate pyrophosphatase family protein